MNNPTFPKHPIYALLDDFFAQAEINGVITEYQRENLNCNKWMMFSDYCLDDKKKANDVITFVLMPFKNNEKFLEMQHRIKTMQPLDIKKTNNVNKDFLSYLKNESVLTFSFVFDDRKHFFAKSYSLCLQSVKETLHTICKCYGEWKKAAVNKNVLKFYDDAVKKFNHQIASLCGKNPDIKLLNDILIAAFLGAYVSAKVLEKIPKIEVFGWFSDRDKIFSGKSNIIVPIFTYFQHNMLDGRPFLFCTSTPDDTVKPFFDDFNRIADVVTGAIADYNMKENFITGDKFNTVLVDFLADNKQNLIFRIHKIDDSYHVGQITMHKKKQFAI